MTADAARTPAIVRALSPTYGAASCARRAQAGFLSLASVFLAVTGAEAIYADMGHFGRRAITRAWLVVALPALMLNYLGQGALILDHPRGASNPFFLMVPGGQTVQTGMVILATMATVIASQAVISGAYSVTQQTGAARVPAAPLDPPHVRPDHGPDLHPGGQLGLLAAVVGLVIGFRNPRGWPPPTASR